MAPGARTPTRTLVQREKATQSRRRTWAREGTQAPDRAGFGSMSLGLSLRLLVGSSPECAWWGAGRGLTSEILYRGGRHFIRPILLRVENMRNLENGVKDDAVGVGVDGCRVLLL